VPQSLLTHTARHIWRTEKYHTRIAGVHEPGTGRAENRSDAAAGRVYRRPLSPPDLVGSFTNIRVADIHACYERWRNRGAEFITEPKDKYGETRCYIRDPDGYIIEVGQSKPGVACG
jgi:predicted enzyme related to lactoylglutathione lyase